MSKLFAPDYGSAVIPAGRVILDPSWLLDELELRLTRCEPGVLQPRARASAGMVLSVAEGFFRTADVETRSWWHDHGLAEVGEQTQREILSGMLVRSPRQLGWAAVTLLANQGVHLLDSEMLMKMVRWVTGIESVTRWIRDGVALSLVVPWFERQEEIVVIDTLVEWCGSQNAAEIRMGLMAGAATLGQRARLSASLDQTMLDLCRKLAGRTDAETACAVGWVLRELVGKNEARFYPELLGMTGRLSRQAMRIAVERLNRELRVRVTSQWRSRIQGAARSHHEWRSPEVAPTVI